jgi:hypothetical protein
VRRFGGGYSGGRAQADRTRMSDAPSSPSTPPAAAITEAGLQALVDAFYAKVRQDPLIGPIFNGAFHKDGSRAFATIDPSRS